LKDVTLVRLRELLSSLPPTLHRTIGVLCQQSAPRSVVPTPAALVQADLTPPHHDDIRLELRCDQHRLNLQEIDSLVAAYQAGESLAALGRQFKLHKRTVHAHLIRAGVTPRRQQVLTPQQVDTQRFRRSR
jgi:hypothetical protein